MLLKFSRKVWKSVFSAIPLTEGLPPATFVARKQRSLAKPSQDLKQSTIMVGHLVQQKKLSESKKNVKKELKR